MKSRTLTSALITVILLSACAGKKEGAVKDSIIELKESKSPYVAFNVWIHCGSQNDPKGKEGLASLTAAMLSESSTRNNSYEQILEKLYPMATGYDAKVDKEMTTFSGVVHKDYVESYYGLFKDSILAPAFRPEDFKRIKTQRMNYLTQTRRFSRDEELTKELLFHEVYSSTPYGHPEEGYVTSVDSITLDDMKSFYSQYYARNNLTVALAGGHVHGFEKNMRVDFDLLPPTNFGGVPKPNPAPMKGIRVLLVEKNTNTSPVSIGFPISLLRSDTDFCAMMLFNSWMGEHRNSAGRLYRVIRETRGINYGDYAYIEAYPQGYATQVPPVNVSRHSQIFEIWLRPIAETVQGNLHDRTLFTIRAAMRELTNVIEKGISANDFESTRRFLKNYVVNYGSTLSRRLAYRIDDAFYGISGEGFLASIRPGLDSLTVERVNAAIRKHLQSRNLCIVVITRDAVGFRRKLLAGDPSPITYAGPQPEKVLEEDRVISTFPIPVSGQNIKIVDINNVFESPKP